MLRNSVTSFDDEEEFQRQMVELSETTQVEKLEKQRQMDMPLQLFVLPYPQTPGRPPCGRMASAV